MLQQHAVPISLRWLTIDPAELNAIAVIDVEAREQRNAQDHIDLRSALLRMMVRPRLIGDPAIERHKRYKSIRRIGEAHANLFFDGCRHVLTDVEPAEARECHALGQFSPNIDLGPRLRVVIARRDSLRPAQLRTDQQKDRILSSRSTAHHTLLLLSGNPYLSYKLAWELIRARQLVMLRRVFRRSI